MILNAYDCKKNVDTELRVIDDFQGEAAYTELMRDPSNMIVDSASLTPMLSA